MTWKQREFVFRDGVVVLDDRASELTGLEQELPLSEALFNEYYLACVDIEVYEKQIEDFEGSTLPDFLGLPSSIMRARRAKQLLGMILEEAVVEAAIETTRQAA